MDQGRWRQIRAMFEAAVLLSPAERDAYLSSAAAGDAELRREVESLLRADGPDDALASRLPLGLDSNAAATALDWLVGDDLERANEVLLRPGSQVGPYTIVAQLGAGGMGRVFRARDPRLGRDVAIKVLPGELERDSAYLARFRREAQLLASLSHPHIATLYGLEEADGRPALVLELIEGPTLQDRLKRGALPQREALAIACQISSALEAAHAKGIVHRDFKPANVALTAGGEVKLLDFGIATVRSALDDASPLTVAANATAAGTLIGTASYMSPEQARALPVDKRSDIWAFGCVLFEMLTGERAFSGESVADTILEILERAPKLEALPATPPAIRRLLRRCLEKNARDRLHDIADARTELEEALNAGARGRMAERQPSIAVLPFANMSAEPDNEYFGDGLAEEILNALTRIPGLKAIARTSSFAFRGKQQDVRQIAEALDVTSVLEGSVRKAGNRIRVVAQLAAAEDGTHLWSQRYDRELSDIFAVQDEIAESIAAALRVTFGVGGRTEKRSANVAAYEAFLKADYYYQKGASGVLRSKELLEHALALDPAYALAHYGLARYYFLSYTCHLLPAQEAVPLIRKHVQDALACDPALAEAHATLGSLSAMYDYDWDEADRRFRLACANDPPAVDVRWQRTNFFWAHAGREREAIDDLSRLRQTDPLNPALTWALAVALRAARRDAEADTLYEEVVELHGGYLSTIAAVVLSGNYLERSDVSAAMKFAEQAYEQYPQLPFTIGQLAAACTRAGQHERAHALTAQLAPGEGFGAPFGLALAALGASDLDEAADWLDKAIDQHDLWVSFLLNVGNIGGRVMWASPRWAELAKRMNVRVSSPPGGLTAPGLR